MLLSASMALLTPPVKQQGVYPIMTAMSITTNIMTAILRMEPAQASPQSPGPGQAGCCAASHLALLTACHQRLSASPMLTATMRMHACLQGSSTDSSCVSRTNRLLCYQPSWLC